MMKAASERSHGNGCSAPSRRVSSSAPRTASGRLARRIPCGGSLAAAAAEATRPVVSAAQKSETYPAAAEEARWRGPSRQKVKSQAA